MTPEEMHKKLKFIFLKVKKEGKNPPHKLGDDNYLELTIKNYNVNIRQMDTEFNKESSTNYIILLDKKSNNKQGLFFYLEKNIQYYKLELESQKLEEYKNGELLNKIYQEFKKETK